MKQMLTQMIESHNNLIKLLQEYSHQASQEESKNPLSNIRRTQTISYVNQNQEDITNQQSEKRQDEQLTQDQENEVYKCNPCGLEFYCTATYFTHISKYHSGRQLMQQLYQTRKMKQTDRRDLEKNNNCGDN